MSVFDHREPVETGKSGKITFPDTRKRTIAVAAGEYVLGLLGLRTNPQGTIDRFDSATGIQAVRESSELSIHQFFDPQNPIDITATATGSTTIDIDGTISTGGNDGVEIHMSTTPGGPYSLETTVDETAFPAEISGLTAATTYYFVLRSFLYDGVKKDASFTSEVSATTGAGGAAPSPVSPAPTIAEISRTATTMTLEATWTDVADETSYEWWAGSDDGTTWEDGTPGTPNTLAADATSVQYTATRKNADHGTFFCIRPCNASGCASQTCNSFTVAGNLTAPSGLAATNPSGSDVDLDWTDMAGASVADETAIERRPIGGSFAEIDTVPFGTTHYDDNGLADGDYEYRVRHRDTGTGDTSPYAPIDNVAINVGGGGSAHPNEPAGYTQVTDRPFSAFDEDGWDDNEGSARLSLTSDATAPTSPSSVAQAEYPVAPWIDGSSPCGRCAQRAITPTSEVYYAFTLRVSSNWYGHDGANLSKIGFMTDNTYGGGGAPSYMGLQGGGDSPLSFVISLQGPAGDEGASTGQTRISANLSSGAITRGVWYEIEVQLVANTASNFDGEIHVWINGTKTHEWTNIKFFDDGADPSNHTWDNIRWEPTYGGVGGNPPQNGIQYMFMDDFYISAP